MGCQSGWAAWISWWKRWARKDWPVRSTKTYLPSFRWGDSQWCQAFFVCMFLSFLLVLSFFLSFFLSVFPFFYILFSFLSLFLFCFSIIIFFVLAFFPFFLLLFWSYFALSLSLSLSQMGKTWREVLKHWHEVLSNGNFFPNLYVTFMGCQDSHTAILKGPRTPGSTF